MKIMQVYKHKTDLKNGFKIKQGITLITCLRDLNHELKIYESPSSHSDFCDQLMEYGILKFLLKLFSKIDNNDLPIVSRSNYSFISYQVFLLSMDIAKFLVHANNYDSLFSLLKDQSFLTLFIRSLFDPSSELFDTYQIRQQSRALFLELSRIATHDHRLLKILKDEGFIDRTAIMLQDVSIYYGGRSELKEAL